MTVGVEEIKVEKGVTIAFVAVLPPRTVLGSSDEVNLVSKVGVDVRVLRVDRAVLGLGTWDADKMGLKFGDEL